MILRILERGIRKKLDKYPGYIAGQINFLLNIKIYPGVVNMFSRKKKLYKSKKNMLLESLTLLNLIRLGSLII